MLPYNFKFFVILTCRSIQLFWLGSFYSYAGLFFICKVKLNIKAVSNSPHPPRHVNSLVVIHKLEFLTSSVCYNLLFSLHYFSVILGYLKDNNAAAHSIESDIFYAVIHLQLHAWWHMDGEVWQGIVTKKRIVIWPMFEHKKIHINLPFTRSRKSKDVEVVGAEI